MTNLAFHNLDLPNLYRRTIGFDRMFRDLDSLFARGGADLSYPPYNLIKVDDTNYTVEVAIAGFKESELSVELKDGKLIIAGRQEKSEGLDSTDYIHRGISARSFERSFKLQDGVEVRSAAVDNGILSIALEHVIPEEEQPKKIPITFKAR